MNLLAVYQTETDWCALVEQGGQRLTLTYAAQPDEARALEDGERAFASMTIGDEVLPELISEGATHDKKAVVREQVTVAAVVAGTAPELAAVAAALHEVAEGL